MNLWEAQTFEGAIKINVETINLHGPKLYMGKNLVIYQTFLATYATIKVKDLYKCHIG